MYKLLLVDDEKRMLELLELYLKPHYMCRKAIGGAEALKQIEKETFDLVLLDIMMPEMDGWEVCEEIRNKSDVPLIMLTARDQKEDIIKGLNLGADDYVTKPFDEEELLARIEALLRRQPPKHVVEVNSLIWDEDRHELSFEGQTIKLTPKEFSMIGYLMKHPNQVFEREQFIELIWGFDSDTGGRTIDSHVRNIRDKIRQTGFPIDNYLKTVWGVGYKWVNSSLD
ncbi:response regulator transcription factor [Alkalibacillus aidingensis]|uniref:response regulator transcription factor n=1 Tax=Alkalibacillus aidingensis TaxID=2747607 RepID=UPI001660CD61|nr:response regulator transcription factor [Alkalibacillus aidingensis]